MNRNSLSPAPTQRQKYYLLEEFRLTQSVAIQWTVLSFAGFFLAVFLFGGLYALLIGQREITFEWQIEQWVSGGMAFLIFILLFLVTIPIHELIHGIAMQIYGGQPRYGLGLAHFLLPYAYATSDKFFIRNQFIAIALAPLIIISLVGVVFMLIFPTYWLVIPLAANAAGAIGDIWMSVMLLRYPSHVRVLDRRTGLRIYGKPGDRPVVSPPAQFFWDFLTGAGLCLGSLLLLFTTILPFLFSITGVEAFSIGSPDNPFHLFQYQQDATGSVLSTFHLTNVLAISGIGGLVYSLLRLRKQR